VKQYAFGYLFVRFARVLAVIVVGVAALFTMSRLWQASTQAETYHYVSNDALEHRLLKLNETYRSTLDLLSHLMAKGGISASAVPQFPKEIQSLHDFEEVKTGLAVLTVGRAQIKHLVIERFETSMRQIESILRAHAAAIHAEDGSTQPSVPPIPFNTQAVFLESLFSRQLDASEARSRIAELRSTKEFLRVVEGRAENPKNQDVLRASIKELDALEALLSSVPVLNQSVAQPVTALSQPAEIDAEKLASRLSHLVTSVEVAVLSSWTLDDALEAATDLAVAEAAKSRAARLAVRGVWLNAAQQLMLVVFGLVFFAFMICVVADVIQALMDTANSTRATAQNTTIGPR
jgi:hypothetical protein